MNLNQLLEERSVSRYRLSKISGVPQSTLFDICSGKTDIRSCSAGTVFKIAKALNVTIEYLINYDSVPTMDEPNFFHKDSDFEIYKSNVCQFLKSLGDMEFICNVNRWNTVDTLFQEHRYKESLYLLAMVDYLSRINNLLLESRYDKYRYEQLEKPVFPRGALLIDKMTNAYDYRQKAIENAIPEFLRFNIIEGDIRNVY